MIIYNFPILTTSCRNEDARFDIPRYPELKSNYFFY